MSSVSCLFPPRRMAILAAAALLGAGAASAQVAESAAAPSGSSQHVTAVSESVLESAQEAWSSSNDFPALSDIDAADPSGIPAAPAPGKGAGDGQYDNS